MKVKLGLGLIGGVVLAGCGGNTVQNQIFNPAPTEGGTRSGMESPRATAKNMPEVGMNAPLRTYKLLPEAHPWAKTVLKAKARPETAKWTAELGKDRPLTLGFGSLTHGQPIGISYAVVDSEAVPLKVTYPTADAKGPATVAVPERMDLKGIASYSVVDRDRNRLLELLRPEKTEGGLKAAEGWERDLRTDLGTSQLLILPLAVHYDEAVVGKSIAHALRIQTALPAGSLLAGTRLRLKALPKKKGEVATSTILKALQEYGAILAPGTEASLVLNGTADLRWVAKDLEGLKELKLSDFEWVEEPMAKKAATPAKSKS